MALEFRDLEPERFDTVTGLDRTEHRLRAAPLHTAGTTESGRPKHLIAAATHAYRRRPDAP